MAIDSISRDAATMAVALANRPNEILSSREKKCIKTLATKVLTEFERSKQQLRQPLIFDQVSPLMELHDYMSHRLSDAKAMGAFAFCCGCFPRSSESKTEKSIQDVLNKIEDFIGIQRLHHLKANIFDVRARPTTIALLPSIPENSEVTQTEFPRTDVYPKSIELRPVSGRYMALPEVLTQGLEGFLIAERLLHR